MITVLFYFICGFQGQGQVIGDITIARLPFLQKKTRLCGMLLEVSLEMVKNV